MVPHGIVLVPKISDDGRLQQDPHYASMDPTGREYNILIHASAWLSAIRGITYGLQCDTLRFLVRVTLLGYISSAFSSTQLHQTKEHKRVVIDTLK